MKAVEAAEVYWATLEQVEGHKATGRLHERACEVLKRHMLATGCSTFRGIELVSTPGGDRVDVRALEAKDPETAEKFRVPVVRRSLVPKRRPRPRASSSRSSTSTQAAEGGVAPQRADGPRTAGEDAAQLPKQIDPSTSKPES